MKYGELEKILKARNKKQRQKGSRLRTCFPSTRVK